MVRAQFRHRSTVTWSLHTFAKRQLLKAQRVSTALRVQLLPLINREHLRSYSFLNHHKITIQQQKTWMSMYMLLNLRHRQTFPKSRALSGAKLACGFLPTSQATKSHGSGLSLTILLWRCPGLTEAALLMTDTPGSSAHQDVPQEEAHSTSVAQGL